MRFFEDLGRVVEQSWRDRSYSEESFPAIAERALGELDAVAHVDAWDVIRYLQKGLAVPTQQDDAFSDVPVTVYVGPRFRVDVYFWLDGTTAIHEHSFSGAFQVLVGSSIHSVYSFEGRREVNAHFSAGDVLLKSVEGLGVGDVRRILPGGDFIHALFHLERPSVTITVRTKHVPQALPQYLYLKPHIALNPFYEEQLTAKKVQSVRMLLRMGHPEAYKFIGEMISNADFQTSFHALAAAFDHLVGKTQEPGATRRDSSAGGPSLPDEWEHFQDLLKTAHRRHGQLVNLLPPVLAEKQRERALIDLREHVTAPELRFFLALLLNLPHRSLVLDMVARRFPERDAVETVCGWMAELSNVKSARSPELNIVGADGFGDEQLFLLRRLLKGDTFEQITASPGNDVPRHDAATLGRLYRSFQNSLLTKSLLGDSPSAARVAAAEVNAPAR
jgi:hypothetical protein